MWAYHPKSRPTRNLSLTLTRTACTDVTPPRSPQSPRPTSPVAGPRPMSPGRLKESVPPAPVSAATSPVSHTVPEGCVWQGQGDAGSRPAYNRTPSVSARLRHWSMGFFPRTVLRWCVRACLTQAGQEACCASVRRKQKQPTILHSVSGQALQAQQRSPKLLHLEACDDTAVTNVMCTLPPCYPAGIWRRRR